MPHMSSDGNDSEGDMLLTGAMSPGAFVIASLRVGDDVQPTPQYTIAGAGDAAHGRLVWDPDHRRNGNASPFFGVAAVRFQLKPGECLLSVGTGDYVSMPVSPYRWIEKIQVGAMTTTYVPGRAIAWDFIEIDFNFTDGSSETRRSNCLPRVMTGLPMRRSVQAAQSARPVYPQQFTEVSIRSRQVQEIKMRGQVTLRANNPKAGALAPLRADDLLGRIQVFTDSSSAGGESGLEPLLQ